MKYLKTPNKSRGLGWLESPIKVFLCVGIAISCYLHGVTKIYFLILQIKYCKNCHPKARFGIQASTKELFEVKLYIEIFEK
ncbi:Uncharacterised protein [Porphyromonas crevioricanis]|uniref:Uncharacterized protein n=1 Tax=Porphyromonas crevioricanis TaxID=393921 RepID=A0A2X4PKC4_9PORP|nr:Uncharacterised protein [Porphyromonas crevioricanis]